MDPDQTKPQLPVKSDSSPTPVHDGTEIQSAAGFLPRSDSIRIDEKIAIARHEGFNPLAIELAIGSYETSAAHKLLLFGLAIIAAALVAFLFPVDRFFKPQTRDLGTMTIGDPISEDNQALFLEFNKPWMKVLLEMDRLYFREGKLSEAIQVAEANLERVPEINWESWKKVHYRYWELLSDAGRTLSLKAATKSYLQTIPEDPFANYYSAQAFLAAVEPIRSFNRDTRQAYRLEAEALVQQIDRASNALKARQKAGGTAEKTRFLQNLYQKPSKRPKRSKYPSITISWTAGTGLRASRSYRASSKIADRWPKNSRCCKKSLKTRRRYEGIRYKFRQARACAGCGEHPKIRSGRPL
jgi:hypothetical protein